MKQLNQTLQSEWVSTASFFWPGALLSVWCFFSSDEHATVRFQPEKSSPDRIAMASPLRVVASAIENRTGTPMRRPNAELRTGEYLTDGEIARLTQATKANRYGHRDAAMG